MNHKDKGKIKLSIQKRDDQKIYIYTIVKPTNSLLQETHLAKEL